MSNSNEARSGRRERPPALGARGAGDWHASLRRLSMNGLFIAVAVVLSVLERWIPISAVLPLPGVKLGLANIVTLFLLFYAGWEDALVVIVLRCLLGAFAFGGMSSLLFSLTGALLALPAMLLATRLHPKWFSLAGVSICGAAAHNLGQLTAASFAMKSAAVFSYAPVLAGAALLMGTLTALVAHPFFQTMERSGLVRRSTRKAGRIRMPEYVKNPEAAE